MARLVLAAVTALAAILTLAPVAQAQPNIVVVMTDDQDQRSMHVMDTVQGRLAAHGVTYVNNFATTPTCCPSRATFLTGQYAHNTGVHSTSKESRARFDHSRTLPLALDRAGYRTGFIGKYITSGADPAPGWDWWRALASPPPDLFNYTLSHDGKLIDHTEYQTDYFGQLAEEFVTTSARPFFLWLATAAPHAPSLPAPRHEDVYADAPLPELPNFDEQDVSDKPAFVRNARRIGDKFKAHLREDYRHRLGTLLAVDEMVGGLLKALKDAKELSKTLVIFTSDNGYMLGEHRLYKKVRLYEESARVPLIVRGPGFPGGVRREGIAGNVDLAPTILDATGARPMVRPDGRSLYDGLGGRDLLLEGWPAPQKGITETSKAVRTRDFAYIEHDTGERELYDLRADPYQLQSLHDAPAYDSVEAALEARLRALEDCAGAMCQ